MTQRSQTWKLRDRVVSMPSASRCALLSLPLLSLHRATALTLLTGQRALAFKSGFDAGRAASTLVSWPYARFARWGDSEWREFGLPPLSFTTDTSADDGVPLVYFKDAGGRSVEQAGGTVIRAQANAGVLTSPGKPGIVLRSAGLGLRAHEAVVWTRLVQECRAGALPLGELDGSPGVDGRIGARLDAIFGACLADRVRKRY